MLKHLHIGLQGPPDQWSVPVVIHYSGNESGVKRGAPGSHGQGKGCPTKPSSYSKGPYNIHKLEKEGPCFSKTWGKDQPPQLSFGVLCNFCFKSFPQTKWLNRAPALKRAFWVLGVIKFSNTSKYIETKWSHRTLLELKAFGSPL